MTIDPALIQHILGWVLQGLTTVGLFILAAKTGILPHVLFMVEKFPEDPPKGPDRPRSA